MSLAGRITDDMKTAMKAKEQERLATLRLIRAELLKRQKEKAGVELNDQLVQDVLQSMVKQRRDSIEQYENAGRKDLAEKEAAEVDVIRAYLPEELSESEIATAAGEVIASLGVSSPQEVGKVMGPLMGRLKATGRPFDGKRVNAIVREKLGA